MIRAASVSDVPAMLAVYTPYVTDTAVTFAYEPPTVEAFTQRFLRLSAVYPWLVLEEDGRILGYACADRAFEKDAYAWCAEVSIYLSREAAGQGRGRALYLALEQALAERGVMILYGLITASNEASLRFTAAMGFRRVGLLAASGWMFGRWHDVVWMEKRLSEGPPGPPPEAR